MIKNILRDVYDRTGCSNRVELALLLVHEAATGMYNRRTLGQELAMFRGLVQAWTKSWHSSNRLSLERELHRSDILSKSSMAQSVAMSWVSSSEKAP
jgi:hypothetical protein